MKNGHIRLSEDAHYYSVPYQSCQKGHRVLYANTARLMGILKSAKAKGTILQELKKIERTDLLILDDL